MQITLERDGYKIIFSSKKDINHSKLSELFNIFSSTIDTLKNNNLAETVSNESIIRETKEKIIQPTITTERPTFRDRLPNNVVDINELTIEQAVKENALVRCPKCGQAHAIIVHSAGKMYMMRKNYNKKEFEAISSWDETDTKSILSACCNDGTDRKLYFEDLQKIPEDNTLGDFIVDNETEIFCPVCTNSNTFWAWKDCFENPLNYFETEQLCDACGGETVDKLTKGKHVIKCEKCGLEQEACQ